MRQNETVGVVSSFCTCGSPLTVEDLLVPYSPAFRRKCARNKNHQAKACCRTEYNHFVRTFIRGGVHHKETLESPILNVNFCMKLFLDIYF